MTAAIDFVLDAAPVSVPDDGSTLLEVLRERLGVRSAKDGCSPQGQCGCCTVWVDGRPRVACVTPIARVAGRAVTTIDGLVDADEWAQAFAAAGASQCGFCTPGIIMRVAAMPPERRADPAAVRQALLAHLCRCTGWTPIITAVQNPRPVSSPPWRPRPRTDSSQVRARLEGGIAQQVGPLVARGLGGFADDLAPGDALVAVLDPNGEWVVAESLGAARRRAGNVPGRRTTAPVRWPLELPEGEWARTLRTTWVEPAYLEPDAAWCEPGGDPASPLGNGGAFGGKMSSEVGEVARRLANHHGRAVRVVYSREDVVRRGPKRPPLAAGVDADGTGIVRVARTAGIADAIRRTAPGLIVDEVDVAGPPTSVALRGAGWAEAAVLLASLGAGPDEVCTVDGATATATIAGSAAGAGGIERVVVTVRCGDPLDVDVLRSYCTGAAHMALGWVRSEAIAVSEAGEPLDLTIRSFGILRAVDVPEIVVEVVADDGPPVNGSDAVFAAVAAAAWRAEQFPPAWPCRR